MLQIYYVFGLYILLPISYILHQLKMKLSNMSA